MSDRRTLPANDRVAAEHLRGQIDAPRYTSGEARSVIVPLTDLCRTPGGRRERQLMMGQAVTVYDIHEGHAFVSVGPATYVGYVRADDLGAVPDAVTHQIAVPAGHAYSEPDMKSPVAHELYFGTRLHLVTHQPGFWETAQGTYVPKPFVRPIDKPFADAATVAQLFFGAPYLWGGNSMRGIDCSGLACAALTATGMVCPQDSDLQETGLGHPLQQNEALQRGDLVFWKGHVAMMVDAETMIHATSHYMAVVYEPFDDAVKRIELKDGPVTSRVRPSVTEVLA